MLRIAWKQRWYFRIKDEMKSAKIRLAYFKKERLEWKKVGNIQAVEAFEKSIERIEEEQEFWGNQWYLKVENQWTRVSIRFKCKYFLEKSKLFKKIQKFLIERKQNKMNLKKGFFRLTILASIILAIVFTLINFHQGHNGTFYSSSFSYFLLKYYEFLPTEGTILDPFEGRFTKEEVSGTIVAGTDGHFHYKHWFLFDPYIRIINDIFWFVTGFVFVWLIYALMRWGIIYFLWGKVTAWIIFGFKLTTTSK